MAGAGIGAVAVGSRRAHRSRTSAVLAGALAALLLASVVGGVVIARSAGTGGSAVAAERIDPLLPLPEIRTQAGADPVPPGTAPLADPVVGNTAVAAALADLQEFWAAQDTSDPVPGLPAFRPPSGGYVSLDSTDPADGTALCVTDAGDLVGNAYYCPGDDGIVFDSAALVPVLIGHYGTAALVVAIAHEFGHAVSDRVGAAPPAGESAPAILVEAQADCHAGAFLAWASDGNTRRVRIPMSSLLRAVSPAMDFRDAVDLPADDPSAHGLGLDRISFLLLGFREGVAACRELRRDTLQLTLGWSGVDTGSQSASTAPRFSTTAQAQRAGADSVVAFAATLPGVAMPGPQTLAATPRDLDVAGRYGQFAAAAAVALAAGRVVAGDEAGASCFVGAWVASVFGTGEADGLGSWAGDADEALDLIRSRPHATFADVAAYVDGFHRGWAAC